MTILSVCTKVAPKIGITVPSVVFTGTTRTAIELQECANEAADMIAKHYEWQALKTIGTFTGDGSTTDFEFPTGYDRMTGEAKLWPSSQPNNPMYQVLSTDEWLGLGVQNFDTVTDRWIIYGGQFHIKPAMASAATAKFFYQSNLIVSPSSGSNKTEFTLDSDSFVLNERTLRLGMIWQWKAQKGLPYAEDLETYEEALAIDVKNDKGPRKFAVGRPRSSVADTFAFPGSITV